MSRLAQIKRFGESYYNRLSIRQKFSFTISVVLLITTAILSFSSLEWQKKILNEKIAEVCQLSVQNLSGVAKENLLMGGRAPIQELISNMIQMKIIGLRYAFVLNRDGMIVAHSDPRKIDGKAPKYLSIKSTRNIKSALQKGKFFEYVNRIYVRQRNGGTAQKILLGVAVVGFSKEDVYRPISYARRILLLITFVIVGIGLIAANWAARQLSSTIVVLANGVRQVRDGNLDVEIPVRSQDELGLLTREFNQLIRRFRENVQMQKFISALTVQMIHRRSRLKIKDDETMERRDIAVLFSDIRSFTTVSEKLEPESLVKLINVYFDLQTKSIEKYFGIVDKFVGDQIMALFLEEEMNDQAIQAAIEIQQNIRKLNVERKKMNKEILQVGIGIYYGPVMIGSMGTKTRMDYTAIGDSVNLGARLCAIAKPGQIIISHRMIREIRKSYSLIKLEPLILKGRNRPVQIYRVKYA
ncbi:adenylate cyclase 1 [bacterium BMS3Abin05]|nr:adenylate cyclase 1 [bacterium BMS3Abin05]GBE27300.1 adenylate cyclase 1 [bacterium BMS3Bbin03]HDZ13075.1 HAMP domain-containing protein [Bacteroidota bacterium]